MQSLTTDQIDAIDADTFPRLDDFVKVRLVLTVEKKMILRNDFCAVHVSRPIEDFRSGPGSFCFCGSGQRIEC